MQRVAARAPASFSPQVKDTQKRLNLLFDHLNREELVKPETIQELTQLADALESRDYETAHSIQVKVQTTKTEECGNWMVGHIRTPAHRYGGIELTLDLGRREATY
jgi:protein transport protein SEC31